MIHKINIILLSGLLAIALVFTGCGSKNNPTTYKDGTYTAEFDQYDGDGYKTQLIVTVQDGEVSKMVFDAINANGELKSQDQKMNEQMQQVQGTNPTQYAQDLINQFMAQNDIDKVDDVAGATVASQSFKTLFKALEKNMASGDETTVIVAYTTSSSS